MRLVGQPLLLPFKAQNSWAVGVLDAWCTELETLTLKSHTDVLFHYQSALIDDATGVRFFLHERSIEVHTCIRYASSLVQIINAMRTQEAKNAA